MAPTWPQLGPQLGPQIAPRSLQEPSKIHTRSHLMFDLFFDRFLTGFDRFSTPKSIKNPSQINQQIIPTAQQPTIQPCQNSLSFCVLLATSAISCYVEMFDKNGSNILPKTALKSTPQLGSILEPTWLHFGRVWGAKLGPSRTKSLQKSSQKVIKKNAHFLDRSWYRF